MAYSLMTLLVFHFAYPLPMTSLPSSHTTPAHSDHTRFGRLLSSILTGKFTPCKPRKDTSITPSVHHPHVLASEHVLLWTTPHSFNFQHELEQLFPELDILKMFFVTIQSLDENTHNNYGAGLLHFMQYCNQCNIPETSKMPTSTALLLAFITDSAGSISNSTANTWLAGLHFWHTVNGAMWNRSNSQLLHHIKQGLTCLVPPNSK
ncbi:hypothetical protein EDD22DRAFT_953872 [Suillus occidentalis]|nr:hypothetical protein EDD22DRAFT_953872 [Suillus occidentalis]